MNNLQAQDGLTHRLNDDQIALYQSNGYITVENVFSADEVAEMRRVTEEFVELAREVESNTPVYDLEPNHSREQPRVRRIKNPASHHVAYAGILKHSRLLDLIEQLIGPNLWSNGNKLNMKSAAFGSPIEWHQDWAFYPQTNDDLLAVGVAIDDMTMENGCMLMVPGSHRGPLFDHHQNGAFVGAITDSEFNPEREEVVPVEVKAGGISIHHARTLHASAPNTSSKSRRLLLIQYCAGDAWPIVSAPPSWEAHEASFVRGKPTTVPRMTNVPVRLPMPNLKPGGTIYELQTQLKASVFAAGKM